MATVHKIDCTALYIQVCILVMSFLAQNEFWLTKFHICFISKARDCKTRQRVILVLEYISKQHNITMWYYQKQQPVSCCKISLNLLPYQYKTFLSNIFIDEAFWSKVFTFLKYFDDQRPWNLSADGEMYRVYFQYYQEIIFECCQEIISD